MTTRTVGAERAREVTATVVDPEMPMLTLADLGVLRGVEVGAARDGAGERVLVSLTPTYSGCPALATMRQDLGRALRGAGFAEVEVAVVLDPPWSSDQITERGRRALREHGLSAPGPAPRSDASGPVALSLLPTRRTVGCPRCGSETVELTSEFGPTACTALYRCGDCREPFEHVKEI